MRLGHSQLRPLLLELLLHIFVLAIEGLDLAVDLA